MTSKFQQELELACTAVQLCAVLTDRLQKDALLAGDGVKKKDLSPVTIGDFAVQGLLIAAVNATFPDDSFLAEESADELRRNEPLLQRVWALVESSRSFFSEALPMLGTPRSTKHLMDLIDLGGKNERSDASRTWVFDPIDGTQTFMKGGQYAINCAFLVDGVEQIGIIGCPNLLSNSATVRDNEVDEDGLGLIIFAVRGEGTWVRPMRGDSVLEPAKRIDRHGDNTSLESLVWSDCSSYTSIIIPLHQQIATRLNLDWPGVDLFSSLMKYSALGLGRCSVVIRIFKYASWRSNMWDHAGGVLIYEEAGGKVTDLDGKSIDFSTGRKMSENYGLVCAPSSVHAHVLEVIQEELKAYGPIPWSK